MSKAISERDKAADDERKAQRKLDREKAKQIEPEIRERAKAIGYELKQVHGTNFRFGSGSYPERAPFSVGVERIYDWLETHEGATAEARAEAAA